MVDCEIHPYNCIINSLLHEYTLCDIPLYEYITIYDYTIDRYCSCFQYFTIINNAAMSTFTHIFGKNMYVCSSVVVTWKSNTEGLSQLP